MADLQFGSIFAQALENSMAEKKAERKWNQQLDFQNTQLKQQKELADKQFAFEQDKFKKEREDFEAVNFFSPTETDPLVAKYNLLRPNERVNQTIYQNALSQAKDYEDYATNFNKNFKFYANKEEAEKALKTVFAKQPDLLQQALAGLVPEETFLGAKQQYGLRNFKPQGFDKNVYDMEGSQYFLPSDIYYDLQNKNYQSTERDKDRANAITTASIGAGPGWASYYRDIQREAKTPVAVEYIGGDGKKRYEYVTKGEYESGAWLNRFGDKMTTTKDGKTIKYSDYIKGRTKGIVAEGPQAVSAFRGDTDLTTQIENANRNYWIDGRNLKSPSSWELPGERQKINEIFNQLNKFTKQYGNTGLTYGQVNRSAANMLRGKIDSYLRQIYKDRVERKWDDLRGWFGGQVDYDSMMWISALKPDEQQLANNLKHIQKLIDGEPLYSGMSPKQTVNSAMMFYNPAIQDNLRYGQ